MILHPLRLLRSGLRRLFGLNVLAVLSLLLGIGLGGLWVRSLWKIKRVAYTLPSYQRVYIYTPPGGFAFVLCTPAADNPSAPIMFYKDDERWVPGRPDFRECFSSFDFGVARNRIMPGDNRYRYVYARIPLWFLMVLTLVLPLCWVRRWRKLRVAARRGRLGLCLQCGYDTRATPDPNGPRLPQCPECGHNTSSAPKTT